MPDATYGAPALSFFFSDFDLKHAVFAVSEKPLFTAEIFSIPLPLTAIIQNQYRYRLPPVPKILTAKPHRQKFQYRYRYRESGFTASGFLVKPPRCRPLGQPD